MIFGVRFDFQGRECDKMENKERNGSKISHHFWALDCKAIAKVRPSRSIYPPGKFITNSTLPPNRDFLLLSLEEFQTFLKSNGNLFFFIFIHIPTERVFNSKPAHQLYPLSLFLVRILKCNISNRVLKQVPQNHA